MRLRMGIAYGLAVQCDSSEPSASSGFSSVFDITASSCSPVPFKLSCWIVLSPKGSALADFLSESC